MSSEGEIMSLRKKREMYCPPDAEASRSGIKISYTMSNQAIAIFGWYDGFVGIEGESMTLREFFIRLGITEKECHKAFASDER